MTDKRKNQIAVILFFLGVVFIIIVFLRGEVDTVLRKAITICLECIGIG